MKGYKPGYRDVISHDRFFFGEEQTSSCSEEKGEDAPLLGEISLI